MSLTRRLLTTAIAAISILVLTAGTAFAFHCTVADKEPDAGVHILFDESTGDVTITERVEQHASALGYDTDNLLELQAYVFEDYKGWFGVDADGDGEADLSVLFPGRTGDHDVRQLPSTAYDNGPDCHGVVHIEDYIANCLTS